MVRCRPIISQRDGMSASFHVLRPANLGILLHGRRYRCVETLKTLKNGVRLAPDYRLPLAPHHANIWEKSFRPGKGWGFSCTHFSLIENSKVPSRLGDATNVTPSREAKISQAFYFPGHVAELVVVIENKFPLPQSYINNKLHDT